MSEKIFHDLCDSIGYKFQDFDLLRQALRHPSYTHENPEAGEHNQRLEFLGDAVVGLVVAEALVQRFPESREGELTRWRAALVSEKPLAKAAKEIGLGDIVQLGKGEESGGGRGRPGLLSDAFEAVMGATFLDGGLDAARKVINTVLGQRLDSIQNDAPVDHKSKIQEFVQASGECTLIYEIAGTTGPDHDKRFEVHLKLGEKTLGKGIGTSKKSAEQQAAKDALEQLTQEEAQS